MGDARFLGHDGLPPALGVGDARMAVFAFIEGRYNPRRRQSAIGYLSPVNY